MWLVCAFLSALFAGVTAVLAKAGLAGVDSNLAVALRTVVVALFAWGMVFVAGSQDSLPGISAKSLAFLVLSGLATGASWLCYFRALALGDVNRVAVIDKSSTVLAMLLAFVFLGEELSAASLLSMFLIAAGTCMMAGRTEQAGRSLSLSSRRPAGWLAYALLSAVFAAATAVLAKVGLADVESNLATAVRTVVVLALSWGIALARGGAGGIRLLRRRDWTFILLSGLATGASWLFFYRALQDGRVSVVVPIDKLSLLVTVAFGCLVFREKLTPLAAAGLALVTAGTLALAL